jgi:hypothetical protein
VNEARAAAGIELERVDFIRVPVKDIEKAGRCNGAGVRDPSGNSILLHHRYAPYPDGTKP